MSVHSSEAAVTIFMAATNCPYCNTHPAIDPSFHGQFCVYCDNDDCPSGEQQAMGFTIEETVALWNERAAAVPQYHGSELRI